MSVAPAEQKIIRIAYYSPRAKGGVMKVAYFILQIMPYISITVFTLSILYRLGRWAGAGIVHNITLSSFPKTKTSAATVIGTEVIFFRSLFKSDFTLWVGAWIMHIGDRVLVDGGQGVVTVLSENCKKE